MKLRLLVALLLVAASGPLAWAQMPPEEQLKTLRVPEGFDISLFASEPLITNPAAIDVDTRGRVWVAEIQWYRRAAKDPPADKLKVLEDTDGDGRADKVTVFAEGLFCPMSVCVAGDKVYVATSPDLWVYEDKDGDLKADGPPRKLLTGFGGHNHDHGAHSLVLGPDHKWWMAHGDTGFNVTGTDGSKIEYRWGAMLRGELDGSQLERIAHNFRNPYEIAVSSFGESFCSDNDNDGNFSVRICWILEGGDYGWFGHPPFGKNELDTRVPPGVPFREQWHFRGHVPGHVPATLMTGFGSPCGMCFYEGDAFGPQYKNAPLHADAGPREVRIYRHENHGYGMKAASENVVTTEGDNYFRPDDVCAAPDGTLYVADWYDGGVGGHAYNDPDRGRIFLLRPLGKQPQRIGKPGPYDNIADAIAGLKNPNLATQYLARERLLAEGAKSIAALKKLLSDPEPNYRARALWVLDRIGGAGRQAVVDELQSDDARFRALAVRILRRHGSQYADQLVKLADDSAPEVQREVLLALRGLPKERALDLLARLAARYNGTDRYQLEAIHIVARDLGVREELYARLERSPGWSLTQLPLMQLLNGRKAGEFVAARLNQSGLDAATAQILLDSIVNAPSAEAGRSLLKLVGTTSAAADLREIALARLAANLSGNWKELASDAELVAVFKTLLADPAMQRPALAVIGDHGLRQLGGEVRGLLGNGNLPPQVRAQAVAVATRLNLQNLGPQLRQLLGEADPALRRAALNALVDLQELGAVREILSGSGPADVQAAVLERLMETTGGALVVLRLIDENRLPAGLKERAIAKAVAHADSNVRVLYEKFVPEDQRPKRLGSEIRAEEILALKGDPRRGEQIFFQSSAAQCKHCHVVGGVGTALGPDLSQIGRKYERATLLETILDPSKAIAPEYVPYLLETDGGQVHAGFLAERSDREVVLRDVKNQVIRVAAEEVVALEPQKKSLMPELVLRDVTAQDAADLLAFLESLNAGGGDAPQSGSRQ